MIVFRWVWRALRALVLGLAALVLLFEEWGWRPLTAWAARLARWAPLARLERRIAHLPPKAALAAFALPSLLLLPVKLMALGLMQRGHALAGVLLVVVTKLLGTAVVGRLFVLTESRLVQFRAFATALTWWRATKRRLLDALHRSWGWRASRVTWRRGRAWLQRRLR